MHQMKNHFRPHLYVCQICIFSAFFLVPHFSQPRFYSVLSQRSILNCLLLFSDDKLEDDQETSDYERNIDLRGNQFNIPLFCIHSSIKRIKGPLKYFN